MTGPVVLLAGPGDTTDIVANYLAARVPALVVVLEDGPSRLRLAWRRRRRVGIVGVAGQILFVAVALPALRRAGRPRRRAILEEAGLDDTPYRVDHRVASVNSDETVALLDRLGPAVVVVNGTRIISPAVLAAAPCPVVNTHAGITPAYRGVHGGYWALADGRLDLVGTTVHLVDPGIDTGGTLARAYFSPTAADSVATYPYLHLAAGLPLLAEQVELARAGRPLVPLADTVEAPSRLRLHPTLWGYVAARASRGVR